MQETRVPFLIQEDTTCWEATKPVHHSFWACALEPRSRNYWSHVPVLHGKREAHALQLESSPSSLQVEKTAWMQQPRPSAAR